MSVSGGSVDAGAPLRVALLTYRGNPYCGGQGVYTRHLARELVGLGHSVEVLAGQPYPHLDDDVAFTPVPGLDLFRADDPWHIPRPWELRGPIDVLETAIMASCGFPEPLTFSLRAARILNRRRGDFDVVHDNQCLGSGLLRVRRHTPMVTTLHHPITVDRDLHIAHALDYGASPWRRFTLRRWYGFLGMQMRVARQLDHVITVSESSRRDIVAQMGVPVDALSIVPVGVDHQRFRPLPHIERVPDRIMVTTSSDVPLKGLIPLLEAVAKVRTERPGAHLVVIGKPRDGSEVPRTIQRLGIGDAVQFVSGVSDERFVELYAETSLAVVPSLYEGFSLPAIEAMACGVPLVATTGGALPEVAGRNGEGALLVPPGDPGALAHAIGLALDDADLRARLGSTGRARVLDRFTWRRMAELTVDEYRRAIDDHRPAARGRRRSAGQVPTGTGVPTC